MKDGFQMPDDVFGYGYYGQFGFELDQTGFFKRDGHSTVEDKNGLNRV